VDATDQTVYPSIRLNTGSYPAAPLALTTDIGN
jgi:hypothetical protein